MFCRRKEQQLTSLCCRATSTMGRVRRGSYGSTIGGCLCHLADVRTRRCHLMEGVSTLRGESKTSCRQFHARSQQMPSPPAKPHVESRFSSGKWSSNCGTQSTLAQVSQWLDSWRQLCVITPGPDELRLRLSSVHDKSLLAVSGYT